MLLLFNAAFKSADHGAGLYTYNVGLMNKKSIWSNAHCWYMDQMTTPTSVVILARHFAPRDFKGGARLAAD